MVIASMHVRSMTMQQLHQGRMPVCVHMQRRQSSLSLCHYLVTVMVVAVVAWSRQVAAVVAAIVAAAAQGKTKQMGEL
jgi:hypothetical protein